MAVAQIKIKQATLNQLRTFAAEHLGIYFADDIAIGDARAQVGKAWGLDTISVKIADGTDPLAAAPAPAAEPAAPRNIPPVTGKTGKPIVSKDMVTVFIEERDEPGGERPVPVNSNGRNMLVPRGEDVQIPYEFYEVLMHAKQSIYTPRKGADGLVNGFENKPREQLSYPIRLVYDPRAAERAAEAAAREEKHRRINEEMEARNRNRAA